jgi:hypothetical protein
MFLILSFMFFLLQNWRTKERNRLFPRVRGSSWHRWEWGGGGERARRVNMCKQCIHMYVNAKMIPVETVPGIRGGGCRRTVEGVN